MKEFISNYVERKRRVKINQGKKIREKGMESFLYLQFFFSLDNSYSLGQNVASSIYFNNISLFLFFIIKRNLRNFNFCR